MKHTTKTIHTIQHKVVLDANEVHRLICKHVLAPEDATVATVSELGDIAVEWDVVKEEPAFTPPVAGTKIIELENVKTG